MAPKKKFGKPMTRHDFERAFPVPLPAPSRAPESQPAATDEDDPSEFPSLGGNVQAQQQNASFAPGVSPWRATRSPVPDRQRYVGIGRGRVSFRSRPSTIMIILSSLFYNRYR